MTTFQDRKWVPCFGTPKHAFEYESMAPIFQTGSLLVKRATKRSREFLLSGQRRYGPRELANLIAAL